jgi:hypothetical protein
VAQAPIIGSQALRGTWRDDALGVLRRDTFAHGHGKHRSALRLNRDKHRRQ